MNDLTELRRTIISDDKIKYPIIIIIIDIANEMTMTKHRILHPSFIRTNDSLVWFPSFFTPERRGNVRGR